MDGTRSEPPNGGDGSSGVTERVADDVSDVRSLAEAVVDVTAEHIGSDPFEMTPLNDAIDTDALESLFRPLAGRTDGKGGSVEFDYQGCRVTVHSDGSVAVRDHLRS